MWVWVPDTRVPTGPDAALPGTPSPAPRAAAPAAPPAPPSPGRTAPRTSPSAPRPPPPAGPAAPAAASPSLPPPPAAVGHHQADDCPPEAPGTQGHTQILGEVVNTSPPYCDPGISILELIVGN